MDAATEVTASYSKGTISNGDTTRVPCTDGFDRVRSVGLWAAPTRGRVVLVAPPAETALLTPTQARELRDRLDELANEVEAAHIKSVTGCVVASPTAV